ncbi:MAG: protein kinase [Lachnospiraceae bacterium]|nr:protein kinase [Lachnospiraceae bacterium]
MNQQSDETLFALPADLASVYEVESCLKYSESNGVGTYLLREKDTGSLHLLKTAVQPEDAAQLFNEKKILNAIHTSEDPWYPLQFPTAVFLKKYVPDDEVFFIRTYIKGQTLEELCETNYEKPGIPLMQSLDYLIALTDILRYLHSLTPPLIHRDIKPQNIIVDPDGGCHFIDLGISRFYQPGKRNDTLVMGTQLTAAPEQFGYKQSDTRSDLYSLGVVFFYCLTGEYTPNDELLAELTPSVAAIIRRATMFDPDQRYQSANEMLADLLAVRFPHLYAAPSMTDGAAVDQALSSGISPLAQGTDTRSDSETAEDANNHMASYFSHILRMVAAVFVIVLLLAAGTRIYLNDDQAGIADSTDTVYTFTEPLIEEAVRAQLGIDEEEAVTEADLEKIVSLHIFGLQVYSDDDEFWFQGDYPYVYDDEMREAGLYERTGTISSLEDITHMPNLHTLCLYRQQISDLSVLADTGLTITELGIGYNPLTDLSPLEGNTDIRTLNLAGLEISDVSVISTLTNLSSLNISSTNIRSLAGLENCTIRELNIYDLDLADYSQIVSLENLGSLEIDHLTNALISAMSETSLTTLFVHSMNGLSISQLSAISTLESLGVVVRNMEEVSLDSIELPALWELDIKNATITDFYGLSSLESLTTLKIYASTCLSYDGLTDIPNLHIISCTEEQAQEIRALYPDADFYYAY